MEEANPIDTTLSMLESTEGRISYVLSILKSKDEISEEEHDYLQTGVLQKDPDFNLIIAICNNKKTYNDIESILKAQLQAIKPEKIEHAEDYSPNTHKKFDEAINDSSPLGQMLMYRKRASESQNDMKGFSLMINKD